MLMPLYIKMFITVLVIPYTLKQQNKAKPWRKRYKLLIERDCMNPEKFSIIQPLKWCL